MRPIAAARRRPSSVNGRSVRDVCCPERLQAVSPCRISQISFIILVQHRVLYMKLALIEFDNVSVMRGATLALDGVSLRIGVGEHVAILGPNGCGKSTLIKAITRECYPLLREDSSVKILGEERWDVSELRTLLGIVSSDLMTTCTRSVSGREIVLSGFFSSIGIWPHQEVTT